ncbi:hypothetical protein EVA_18766 [gut metagenome]|uniref:Uncharacterized protein n=1 Tax=gut metagenome TaxID=749906 RepID=J9FE05_9ZZZZ
MSLSADIPVMMNRSPLLPLRLWPTPTLVSSASSVSTPVLSKPVNPF